MRRYGVFVTVGGAIANDVHGKNHHRAGTFGCHVRSFELLRSDGARWFCSAEQNADWFRATIGGLGLTGFITWAEMQLKSIGSCYLQTESIRCANLDEFFHVSAECDEIYEYTVAWVDCLARGKALGRGLFLCGNHMAGKVSQPFSKKRRHIAFPFQPPFSIVNRASLKAFNWFYYHRQRKSHQSNTVYYEPFFYPLDAIGQWNRMYGRRGFMQYQCLVPKERSDVAVREMLDRISAAGKGSFLAVLKAFGDRPSPGLLSFPRAGITLALDFPNEGKTTFDLLNGLDNIVRAAEGRVYPGKDARMSPESFAAYYPHWKDLTQYRDSRFSSSFWRRVTGEPR